MEILLPNKLSIRDLKSLLGLDSKSVQRYLLFISYLCHRNRIVDKYNTPKLETVIPENHEHEVPSISLKKIFGNQKYKQALDSLELFGFININHSYFHSQPYHNQRGRSKSYQLKHQLFTPNIKYKKYQVTDKKTLNAFDAFKRHIATQKKKHLQLSNSSKKLIISSMNLVDPMSIPKRYRDHFTSGPSMDRFGLRLHSAFTVLKTEYRNNN